MLVAIARAAARSLFTLGMLFGFAAFLAIYGAYRLLRFVTIGAPAQPRQRAAFELLLAIVNLARAMRVDGPTFAELAGELEHELESTEAHE